LLQVFNAKEIAAKFIHFVTSVSPKTTDLTVEIISGNNTQTFDIGAVVRDEIPN
jgi:hypothetical protein